MTEDKKNTKEKNQYETDHEYDGIQENDNPLPRWWLATFYGAIVFSVLYFAYYHISGQGLFPFEQYQQDALQNEALILTKRAAEASKFDEARLNAVLKDTSAIRKGRELFESRCMSCHAADGGGLIGPNLTDQYWKNGDGKITSIAKIIYEGVLAKGMPAWNGMMSADELINVAAYVKTLQGKKTVNPKAPEGTLYKN